MKKLGFGVYALLACAVSYSSSCRAEGIKWTQSKLVARGVTLREGCVTTPRKLRIFDVKVDLQRGKLRLVASGRAKEWGQPFSGTAKSLLDAKGDPFPGAAARTKRETVTAFLLRHADMVLACAGRTTVPPYLGNLAQPPGLVISDGTVVTDTPSRRTPVFVAWKNGTFDILDDLPKKRYAEASVALSAHALVRRNGRDAIPATRTSLSPRLLAGYGTNRALLHIVAIDDGASTAYSTGANYHEANDILAELGVTDAVCLDHATATAIVTRDAKGNAQFQNAIPGKSDSAALSVVLGLVPDKAESKKDVQPKRTPVSVRFVQSRLTASRDRSTNEVTLRGVVVATLQTERPRIRRPILNVVGLFDIDGVWRYCDTICTDQDVWYGTVLDRGVTVERVSKWQPEVTASAWMRPTWGDPRVGFFHTYGLSLAKAKLLAYRIEVWQDGESLAFAESDRTILRREGVPDDWYVKGRHPSKISYRWPPSKP